MAPMFGADVQALTDLANAVDQAANQLAATRSSVNGKVQNSAWVGPVADRFRSTWSSGGNSQVAAAAQLLGEASTSLRRNAAEQTQASSVSGSSGSFTLNGPSSSGTPSSTFPEGSAQWLEGIDKATAPWPGLEGIVSASGDVYGRTWALIKTADWSSTEAFKLAGEWGVNEGPKVIGAVDDFFKIPGVNVADKALLGVGAVVAVGGAVATWTDPKSTAWNKTESTVGAVLSVGALIPGPQEPFVAAAAGLWAVGTWAYDNHAAIGQFASDTAANIGHAAETVGKAEVAGATAAVHVATEAVQKGEQVAGDLSKAVSGFFSGW